MSRYYDLDGNPITWEEWIPMLGNENRIIKQDRQGEIFVSTVWLGLDHGWGGDDAPLIFETMIFGGEHDQYQERYTTKEQALEGHEKACALAFGESHEGGEASNQ